MNSAETLNKMQEANASRSLGSGRDFRDERGLGSDTVVISFAGRLVPAKGVLQLVEAVNALSRWNVHLFIAGSGPLDGDLRNVAGDSSRISVLGPLGRSDMASLLLTTDIFCLPANYPEGLPTVLLEAAACGCCLVSTDTGGTEEIIPTPSHGLIIANNEPETIAHALEILLRDKDALRESGCVIQRHVESCFSWEQTVRTLVDACDRANGKL